MDPATLQLLEGFAHELRTPLSAIAGHSGLLSLGVHGPLSDAQAHALGRIDENKKQMIALISNLLSYAEAASGATTLSREERALWPIVTQAVATLADAAREHDVRFDWPDPEHTNAPREGGSEHVAPDTVLINESAAREVITIMLADALAHSERDSVVPVRVQFLERSLRVVVETRAPAMVHGAAELLFVPYARDQHGRPLYAPGLALALPRARALARSMGADVSAVHADSSRVLQFDLSTSANPRPVTG